MVQRHLQPQLISLLADYPAVALPGREPWAIEIKRSLEPRLSKGFHHACADIKPEAKFVVYPGDERFKMSNGVEAINVAELAHLLA